MEPACLQRLGARWCKGASAVRQLTPPLRCLLAGATQEADLTDSQGSGHEVSRALHTSLSASTCSASLRSSSSEGQGLVLPCCFEGGGLQASCMALALTPRAHGRVHAEASAAELCAYMQLKQCTTLLLLTTCACRGRQAANTATLAGCVAGESTSILHQAVETFLHTSTSLVPLCQPAK